MPNKFLCFFFLLFLLSACKKDPGDGGNSVIKGTVIKRDYIVFPPRYSEGPAKDEDVYIIYGDDGNAFDDRTKTSYDGSFKFETLKKGKYRIYVYSDDTTSTNYGNKTQIIVETEITKNRSTTELPAITTIGL